MDEHGWPFLSRRPRHCKGDGQVQARAPYLLAGRRLGAGRGPGASARSWLQAGSLPSTLVRWAQSWSRRLAAKACNAAWVNMAVQRLMRAAATECWRRCGACRALACARSVTNLAASSLHLPPVSMPRTTSRHRRLWRSSGYVRSFLRRASINAVPAYCPALRRGRFARPPVTTRSKLQFVDVPRVLHMFHIRLSAKRFTTRHVHSISRHFPKSPPQKKSREFTLGPEAQRKED